MTRVNIDLADSLLGELIGWADMTPETVRDIFPTWDPRPDTYQEDLEHLVRDLVSEAADRYHPLAMAGIKAAMRWVLRDAPDYADDWFSGALCGPEEPPEPVVKLWEWAWDEVFGDESWDIEGEVFELYIDPDEAAFSTKKGWDNRPAPNPRPVVWPSR